MRRSLTPRSLGLAIGSRRVVIRRSFVQPLASPGTPPGGRHSAFGAGESRRRIVAKDRAYA